MAVWIWVAVVVEVVVDVVMDVDVVTVNVIVVVVTPHMTQFDHVVLIGMVTLVADSGQFPDACGTQAAPVLRKVAMTSPVILSTPQNMGADEYTPSHI